MNNSILYILYYLYNSLIYVYIDNVYRDAVLHDDLVWNYTYGVCLDGWYEGLVDWFM